MDDSIYISLRFALYIDLMLLFGLALFGLYSLKGKERTDGAVLNFGSLLVGTAVIGILLSMAAMLHMAKTMSGVSSVMELHHHILQMMLMDTEVGLTWMVRIASLTVAIIAARLNRRAPSTSLWLVSLCGAIALATLAWTGHGAMDEGSRRYLHFTSDIVHLLGAGSWLGAIAAFALLLRTNNLTGDLQVHLLARTLTGFESAGMLIVATLTITGIANYLLVVGPAFETLTSSTYGALLSLKVFLFFGMLVFAAVNRFHLSPLLKRSIKTGTHKIAINALRRSMILELLVAVIIMALVAWLGTLSPEMEMEMEMSAQ
ncbi:copper homeostasis membrane protein CopD [Pseudomonas umsongensis]|jgi:putative copper resistance protein D|uniref:copper homeostasis membrane protein CopD n=1 Tax=Pseudomonas umsongensis TaxID=198618 RepID=UPI00141341B1|nr:copper homeostasis membrane protein CopD [Pseudomonas umsongensis]MCK8655931.1 copper homeostasis membrane protein CopD [Pseudomonas umsongensis]NBB62250.1 copper homeostasis membrane protein CopD [Pseudomonas sp. ODNR1LW]